MGTIRSDGQASPNSKYPQDIRVVKGENNVKVQNKNFLRYPYSQTTRTFNGITITDNGDGSLTFNGTSTGEIYFNMYSNSQRLKMKAGTYTFSIDKQTNGIFFEFQPKYKNGSDIPNSHIQLGNNVTHVTSTIDIDFEVYCFIYIGTGKTFNNFTIYPILEIGSTSSQFIPHQEQNYTITLPEGMELAGNIDGTIRDEIVGSPNNWYLKKNILKIVFDGTETINIPTTPVDSNHTAFRILLPHRAISGYTDGFCSNFRIITDSSEWLSSISEEAGVIVFNGTYQQFYIRVKKSIASTIEELRNYLSSNNISLYYPLQTPIEEPITDTTLIKQLNKIYENAVAYDEETNIEAICSEGNVPFVIEVEAISNDYETRIEALEEAILSQGANV